MRPMGRERMDHLADPEPGFVSRPLFVALLVALAWGCGEDTEPGSVAPGQATIAADRAQAASGARLSAR